MEKKAQIGISSILIVFITVIVGLTLFLVIAQETGVSTSTVALANDTTMAVVAENTPQYFTAYKNIADVVIYNATGNALIPASNYTVTNNVIRNGALVVNVTPHLVTADLRSAWLISGTAQATDYIDDSAARSVTSLIAIFFALGIAVIAMGPVIKQGLDSLGN